MKKDNQPTIQKLFENMEKLNPDFKKKEILSENDDKWIQKAVNPLHKGFCSPLNKKTCTPKRKALAMRFKKGIENEAIDLNQVDNPEELKLKADKLKIVIDKLYNNHEYDILDSLYRLLIDRKQLAKQPMGVGVNEDISPEYEKKAELIKKKIDFLAGTSYSHLLNKVDELLNKLFPFNLLSNNKSETNLYEIKINEKYNTLNEILDVIKKRI